MALPEGLTSYAWVGLCAVAAPTVLGLGIVRTLGLRPEHGRRLSWAFAYLTGHLALAGPTLLWVLSDRTVPGVLLPMLALGLGIWLLWRAARRRPATPPRPPTPPTTWLPLALVVAALAYDCLRANADPVRLGDEAQIWAAKAHVLFGAERLDAPLAFPSFVGHADYPMLDPLVQVLAFAGAGRVLHWENRLPMQCFAVALLLLLSAAMTRRSHPVIAALALVAFAGTLFENGARTVAADVLVSFATLAAVEALLRLRERGERIWWRLACLAVTAMLASKNEGALLAVAVAAPFLGAWLLERRRDPAAPRQPRAERLWLLAPVAALLVQAAFNHRFGLRNDLFDPAMGQGRGLFARMLANAAENVGAVSGYYGRLLVDPASHRLLPLTFLGACLCLAVLRRGRLPATAALLAAIVVAALAGYMLVFVGTHAHLGWHLDTAAARTMQQIVPVAALGVCVAVWPRAPTVPA